MRGNVQNLTILIKTICLIFKVFIEYFKCVCNKFDNNFTT